MLLIMRVFFVILLLPVSGAYADVTLRWEPSSDGRTMAYYVLSATPAPLWGADQMVDCGSILQSSKCSVQTYINFTVINKDTIPLKGRQRASAVVSGWVSVSQRGFIGNWGELVDKNGGRAPCIMFAAEAAVGSGTIGSSCDGRVTPPPEPPTPPASCYVNGDIYLRHGSLADGDVAGNRASAVAYVYCTKAASIKVRALAGVGSNSYTVTLRADGSLKSLLSVDGYVGNGGSLVEVPAVGGKAVTFASTLVTSGLPAPGDFSGSAVAVVDIL